jgi:hypothetical protein
MMIKDSTYRTTIKDSICRMMIKDSIGREKAPFQSHEVSGHDFSRAESIPKETWALAPEIRRLGLASLTAIFAFVLLAQAAAQNATPLPQQPPVQPNGKVIFSRSIDENGQTTTQSTLPETQTAVTPKAQSAPPQMAEDVERQAITFTSFDMDVHHRPADHHIAVRALLTHRNDGNKPLAHIPLQISSSLNWERIRINARDVTFQVATLNSDADHTGQVHEAAVPLAQPLAPGSALQLDVTYSGPIPVNAQRLLAIGTPDEIAFHSDWDQVDLDFTGLRGFGNVVWYPVSSVPVILGDGARLFDEIGEHKLRLAGAHFHLRLTVEFPHGRAPSVALINGHPAPLAVTDQPGPNSNQDSSQDSEISGVATADNGGETLGFEAPSLFVAIRTPHTAANTILWVLPDDETAVQSWSDAATTVTPFLQSWLGQRPRSQLTLLDLPDPQDAPYETGSMLATAIRAGNPGSDPGPGSGLGSGPGSGPGQLNGILVHALTHAWLESPRAWLSEGVAHFMGTLWTEKQRGRDQALGTLEAARPSLALAEPESPGQSLGQPLDQAISPVYYRTKAAYVFWMLRQIAGDATLSAALRAYDPKTGISQVNGRDPGPSSPGSSSPGTSSFEKLLEQSGVPSDRSSSPGWQSGPRQNLAWFFADWVNADKGLPDLSITNIFSKEVDSSAAANRPTSAAQDTGNWLVTVTIANNGYASAEVPITVHSNTNSVTQRVVVPARSTADQHLLVQGKPTEVQANDGTIPETQATIHITRLDQATGPAQPSTSSSTQPGPTHP